MSTPINLTPQVELTPRERKVYERLLRAREDEGYLSRSRLTHSLAYLGSSSEVVELLSSLCGKGLALSRTSRTGSLCYSLIPPTPQFLKVTEVDTLSIPTLSEGMSICPLCKGDRYILNQKFEDFKSRVLELDGMTEEPIQINEGSISNLLGGGDND